MNWRRVQNFKVVYIHRGFSPHISTTFLCSSSSSSSTTTTTSFSISYKIFLFLLAAQIRRDKPEMTRSQPRDGRPEGELDDILGMRETKPDRLRKRSSSMRNPTARIRRIERLTRQEGDPGRDGGRRGEGPAAESQFEGEVDGILRPFEEMRRRDDVDG